MSEKQELTEEQLQAALEEQQRAMKKLSDVAKAFDVTSSARGHAYESVQKLLTEMAEKDTVEKDLVLDAVTHLLNGQMLLDQLVRVMLRDTLAFTSLVSENTAYINMNNGRIRAVALALARKNLVEDAEIAKIYNEEILPQMREDMGVAPPQEVATEEQSVEKSELN